MYTTRNGPIVSNLVLSHFLGFWEKANNKLFPLFRLISSAKISFFSSGENRLPKAKATAAVALEGRSWKKWNFFDSQIGGNANWTPPREKKKRGHREEEGMELE